MEFVTLRNGVKMPIIGFGTWPLKGGVLTKAFEYSYNAGCRLYDTANLYENETDLGKAYSYCKVQRNSLFLTSKIQANQYHGRKRYLYLNRQSVSTAYIKSCKKLNTCYLDLYLLHSPFKGYLKAYGELLNLYKKEKVKAIGVCNCNIDNLREIYSEYRVYPMVNQIELHPFNQQHEILEFCSSNDIQVEAYSPFAHGVIMKELMDNEILINIATAHNRTITQIILRWLVQLNIVVIPRSTSKKHIEENYNVFDFQLSENEMGMIKSLDRKEAHSRFAKSKMNDER